MGKRKPKAPETLEDKVRGTSGGDSFVEGAYSSNEDQLKTKLLELASYDAELDKLQENDDDLKQKQLEAREAAKNYSEPRAANRLKRKLIVEILSSRGKA